MCGNKEWFIFFEGWERMHKSEEAACHSGFLYLIIFIIVKDFLLMVTSPALTALTSMF